MAILAGNNFNIRDFSPALWLDAADSNTLFDAVSGGALVGAGGSVARWEDKSGNGRHATQATLANRPLRTVGAQNTRDALTFDGTDDFMIPSNSLSVLRNVGYGAIFAVCRRATVTADSAVLHFSRNGNSSQVRLGLLTNSPSGDVFRAGARRTDADVFIAATRAANVNYNTLTAIANYSAGTLALRENGVQTQVSLLSSGLTSNTDSDASEIGKIANNYLNGSIAEIIVFNNLLNDERVSQIERYLANKWGLGFNPLSLSPALWLDASDSNTLYDATAGGALVGAGGSVARWEDKSGNGRHATQATLANRPIRTAAAQGGKDALRFDGTDDTLTITNGGTIFRNVSSGTVFAIVRPNIAGTAERSFFSNLTNTGASNRFTCGINRVSSQWIYGGRRLDNDSFQGNDVIGHDANSYYAFVAQLRWGLAERQLWINGVSLSNVTGFQTAGNTSDTNGNGTFIGANAGINQYFLGNIAEIIVFNYQITTAQRQAVERYLAQKWNIIP